MRPVDAGLRQWIADKKARAATYDLPQQAACLPRYLAPSGVERWRCLRRLVTASSCRRPVCSEQAASLAAAGDSTAKAAVAAVPGCGQPRGSQAGVGCAADDSECLGYYRGKRPPRSAHFTLTRAGDELIALECLRGYQRALACHTKRALQERPAVAAPATAARLDLRLGKVLLESSESRATTVSPRQQPSAAAGVVLPPPTSSSQPPTGRGGRGGTAAARPSAATLAASSKAASLVVSPEPSAASDDDSGSRGGVVAGCASAAAAGTKGAKARHASTAVPPDAGPAAAAAVVPLRGGTLDVSYSEKEARMVPRWAHSGGGGGGGAPLLPCRRVRVWKAAQCGLPHTAGCFGQRLLEKFTCLSMLDLSWNSLERVPEGLGVLASLRILYLHSNEIGAYDSLAVLGPLRGLSALTLHGNPLEAGSDNKQQVLQHTRTYKSSVLAILPCLKTLDHSVVTKSDASPK